MNPDSGSPPPADVPHLIVNADDFGLCAAVNDGIVVAHDHGIVTSASLMVHGDAAVSAAALASERPGLSLGLHVDLAEWIPVGDEWHPRYERVDVDDPSEVEREARAQLDRFILLTGSRPTHLDGHQHIQRDGQPAVILRSLAVELGISLRLHDPRVRYCGDFYGQLGRGHPFPDGICVAHLVSLIATLEPGWTELACHPGLAVDATVSSYASERAVEVVALCDPSVRAAIVEHRVQLGSFDLFAAHSIGPSGPHDVPPRAPKIVKRAPGTSGP